jgi:hypothetical protein
MFRAVLMTVVVAVGLAGAVSVRGATFDHSTFDALLRRHVADGLVDYDAFKDAPEFRGYLDALAAFDPSALGTADRLAFWINTYNAYTIELINKHGERKSIRNVDKALGSKLEGPWKEELVVVGGRRYHLDNVEHDIIRKEFREPRIHYALVCAAMSCPPLRSEAYRGDRLEEQLDDQARAFLVRSPKKNRVDVATKTFYVSKILGEFYRDDFGGTDAAIGRHAAAFYPAGAERDLLAAGTFTLKLTDYDWSLNGRVGRGSGGGK